MTARSDEEFLARFGWIPDAAAVAEVDARHRKARARAELATSDPESGGAAVERGTPGKAPHSAAAASKAPAASPWNPPRVGESAQGRAVLDPIDTPEKAARSPWWPEEAA